MQTLEEKASASQAQQEIENLKAENRDLSEKLETLKSKKRINFYNMGFYGKMIFA